MLCEENLLSIKEKGKKWDRHGDHLWTNELDIIFKAIQC